jgi:hypothetical protein
VTRIDDDGSIWVTEPASGHGKPRTVHLPAEYVAEHAHLSYASTAYGVQGATVAASHTVVSESMSAAGLYVGLTRGRQTNLLHVVAADLADAREQFTDAIRRDRADRGLTHATKKAAEDTAGLVAVGPVKIVTDRVTALMKRAEQAERRAAHWMNAAASLAEQRQRHQAEADDPAAVIEHARASAEQTRAQVFASLFTEATTDADTYLAAVQQVGNTERELRATSRFRRGSAQRAVDAARDRADEQRATVTRRWGGVPVLGMGTEAWARRAAEQITVNAPEVTTADQAVTDAEQQRHAVAIRHQHERAALRRDVYADMPMRRSAVDGTPILPDPTVEAVRWTKTATTARAEADALRSMPLEQAAARIETARAAEQQRAEQQRAEQQQERERQARQQFNRDPHRPDRRGPARGL